MHKDLERTDELLALADEISNMTGSYTTDSYNLGIPISNRKLISSSFMIMILDPDTAYDAFDLSDQENYITYPQNLMRLLRPPMHNL